MRLISTPLFVSLAASMLLGGCRSSTPGVEIRTVQVSQPQPCLPPEKIPDEPARVAGTLTGDAETDLSIITASALLLRAWGQEMHSALVACAN